MSKFPDSLTNLVQFDGQTMAPEFGKWGSYLYDQQYRTTGIRITTGHVGRGA